MPNEIKDLLNDIIDDTNKSYPEKNKARLLRADDDADEEERGTITGSNPQTFDRGEFKEKLSLYVLSDLVHAMMHDETKDLDGMIDDSIMKHIHDDYHGTCYGYLCAAGDRLKSPILKDIVQEMDDITDETEDKLQETKDPDVADPDNVDMDEMLKNVSNYDELRIKLKDAVSKKVVDDVSNVISKSNDAPVFDDLDEKLAEEPEKDNESLDGDTIDTTGSDMETSAPPESSDDSPSVDMNSVSEPTPLDDESDTTTESVILRMCGTIVTESAIEGKRMSVEEGMNQAIIHYCINELDYLFKARPRVSIYQRYLK